ncbi:MAG: extracellular solute-binding protein [Bacilli bacterium]|nr:extracellular solute-binding protein [Bacilli bacterium]
MKKKILVPVMVLTSILALAGCSNGGGNSGDQSTESKPGEKVGHFDHKVTIKFTQAYAQGYQAKLQAFVDSFKEIEPNVEIKLEDGWISGNYDTIHSQTISDIQTGEYGDLVIAYPDHVVDYLDFGKAVKLDDFMTNAEYGWTEQERADLVQAYIKEGQEFPLEGTYCLPFSKSTEAMFYNETRLFDSELVQFLSTKGITMNKAYIESLTWEELFGKLCPAFKEYDAAHPSSPLITEKEGSMNSYVGYDSDANLFITLSQQYGYGYTSVDEYGEAHLDYNNDNMKGLMKTFADASKNGYLRSPGVIGKSYSSNYFKENNVLFSIGSTAGVKNQVADTFDVGVTRIPQAKDKAAKIISQGPSICILDHNGDKDRQLAAWLFYKHMVSTKNTASWAIEVGYLPVRASAYTSEAYSDYCSTEGKDARSTELLTALNAVYSSSTVDKVFTTPPFKGSSTARTEVNSLMVNVLKDAADGKTIDDTYLKEKFDLAVNNTLKDM